MPAFALSPIAWSALRIGAVAAMAVYASRRQSRPKDVAHEAALDDLPAGWSGHAHRAEAERALHGAARLRRVVRVGPRGAGIEIEAAGIGRIRMRRVD